MSLPVLQLCVGRKNEDFIMYTVCNIGTYGIGKGGRDGMGIEEKQMKKNACV